MPVNKWLKILCLTVACAGCSDTDLQSVDILDDASSPLGDSVISDADFRANEINGSVVSTIESFDSSGNLTVQASYVFNADDVSISQFSVDDSGATLETHRYFLDARGLVNQINVLNQSDNSVQTQTLERDASGKLLRFESPEDDDTEIYEYRYENNRIVSRTQSFENDDQRIEGLFSYAASGQLMSIAFTDNETNETSTIFYTNNAQGRVLRSEVDALTDGTVDLTLTFLYDDAGNVTVIDRFNRENALTSRRVFTYERVDFPATNIPGYSLFYFP